MTEKKTSGHEFPDSPGLDPPTAGGYTPTLSLESPSRRASHAGGLVNGHNAAVNSIKCLSMDAVQAANSGHPGMPMGAADMAVVLWASFLKHDPSSPDWADRDRFILSAGHGSMLIYSLLHLAGYDVSLDDIKAFRQWGSKTPGHPEYGHTPGVETTTGPLGQGFATGVGMAIAERKLREEFGEDLCDHWTYGIVSDGDLMEGISYEAASLAGHLKLGRLVYLYDDNAISIDGSTDLSFTEDRTRRFEAMGWHVQTVDGHDAAAIANAIHAARTADDAPSLICCRTVIGQGSLKEGTSKTHGAPLGADDIAQVKRNLGLDPEVAFQVVDGATDHMRRHGGTRAHAAWASRLADHPRRAEFEAMLKGDRETMLANVTWPDFETGASLATRKASAACLKALVAANPNIIGGSADLSGSNGVAIGQESFLPSQFKGAGSLHFGVREHAMGAICNGIALHGGFVAYGATFLMFHDYMRPAVRLAALMGVPSITVYTHDSIFLGEDGPTHQPIGTLAAMRAIPNVAVIRPADANETLEAWKAAIQRTDGPTCLVLTRQGLPIVDRQTLGTAEGLHHGGYILKDAPQPAVCLVATGSEVALALGASEVLTAQGIACRVISMPWVERFLEQSTEQRNHILPPGVPRVTIEAGSTMGWHRIIAGEGLAIGIDGFGASAPAAVLAERYGLTASQVAARVAELLG